MQVTIEKINGTAIKMNFISEADDFEKGLQKAFEQKKAENEELKEVATKEEYMEKFGTDGLYEDGLNIMLNDLYGEAVASNNIIICGDPSVNVDFATVGIGKQMSFSITVDAYPEIKLPDYLNMEVDAIPIIVKKEDVDNAISDNLNTKIELVDANRKLRSGDIAIIDFTGYLNDTPFEGGHGEDFSLEIGSHTFIGDFEEQLIGMMKGETKKITVVFPENYHADFLKGKTTIFEVTLKKVKAYHIPKLDDNFVKDLNIEGIDNVEKYVVYMKNTLIKNKIKEAQDQFGDRIVEKVVREAEFVMPEGLIHQSQLRNYQRIENLAKVNNVTVEDIFKQYGILDVNDYYSHIRDNCDYEVRRDLVLTEIAKQKNLVIDEEDYEKEIQKLANETQKTVEILKEEYPLNSLTPYLLTLKAIDLVKKHASIRLLIQTDYN